MHTLLEEKIGKSMAEVRKGLADAKGISAAQKTNFLSLLGSSIEEIENRRAGLKGSQEFGEMTENFRLWTKKLELNNLKRKVKNAKSFDGIEPLAEPAVTAPKAESVSSEQALKLPLPCARPKKIKLPQEYELWRPLIEQGKFDAEAQEPSTNQFDAYAEVYGSMATRRWELQDRLSRIEKKIERLEEVGDKKGELPDLHKWKRQLLLEIEETRKRPEPAFNLETGRHNGHDKHWEGFVPPERLTAPSQWNASINDARLSEHFKLLSNVTLIKDWRKEKDK